MTATIPTPLHIDGPTSATFGLLGELHTAEVIVLPDAFVEARTYLFSGRVELGVEDGSDVIACEVDEVDDR